jgi:hypothetical protein
LARAAVAAREVIPPSFARAGDSPARAARGLRPISMKRAGERTRSARAEPARANCTETKPVLRLQLRIEARKDRISRKDAKIAKGNRRVWFGFLCVLGVLARNKANLFEWSVAPNKANFRRRTGRGKWLKGVMVHRTCKEHWKNKPNPGSAGRGGAWGAGDEGANAPNKPNLGRGGRH